MPTLRIAGRTDVFGDAWPAAALIGGVSVALGIVILVWSDKPVGAMDVLVALCLVVTALWQLTGALSGRLTGGLRALQAASAIVALVLAVWCLRSGDWVAVLALWVGLGWAIRGVVQAIVAVWSDELRYGGLYECYGVLTLCAGVLLMIWPIDAVTDLSWAVGLAVIVLGCTEITAAVGPDRTASAGDDVGLYELLNPPSRTGG